MIHTPHIDLVYERELHGITQQVAAMADHAENMVRDALLAMMSSDDRLTNKVIEADARLDEMETRCDRTCVALLAKRAPVGADLRMVIATLKMVTDLERIGDLAVNIVKRARELRGRPMPEEIVDLARSVTEELGVALAALKARDATAARRMRDHESATDARNRAAFDRLMKLAAASDETGFANLLASTSICRHLERIGDHSVNLAEMVVYMVDGQVVRHADLRADLQARS